MIEANQLQELRERVSKHPGIDLSVMDQCIEEILEIERAKDLREFIAYAPKDVIDVWDMYTARVKVKRRQAEITRWLGLLLGTALVVLGLWPLFK